MTTDLAANNGGWQGRIHRLRCTAVLFRISIRPGEIPMRRGAFIRRYVPEVAVLSGRDIHAPWLTSPVEQRSRNFVPGRDYPLPIVDMALLQPRTLAEFKRVLGSSRTGVGMEE